LITEFCNDMTLVLCHGCESGLTRTACNCKFY